MSKQPLVSVVVLNWNGLADTKTCLESLRKLKYKHLEIVVVDNGSEDGSKQYLSEINDITFVDLPENTGFAGGHIIGLKNTKGEYVALLNNDCVVATDWLNRIIEVFEAHPDAAAVGGKSFSWNDQYPEYDENNPFSSYQEVEPFKAYTRTLLTGEQECLVDAISGAALVIDKSKLEGVGYLDEDFFAYYEETDLLARLKRHGFNVYYTPKAHIWHKVAASSDGGEAGRFYLYQMHRNRYYFAYKNFDEPNLKRFINSYSREMIDVRLKKLLGRGDHTENNARLEAYDSIKKELPILKSKRDSVLKLGKSYSSTLAQQTPEDVTVVIPCFNYANYVAEAINSVLRQSHPATKILIINDGSTDSSLDEISKFKHYPNVQIIDKQNEGVIATKNLGIKLSTTYWTMFLDADDYIDEDTLKIMLRAVNSDGMVDVTYSDMRLFGAASDIFRARPFQPYGFLFQNFINNTTLINTTMLKRSGGYKPEMSDGLEDWELYITLFEQGAKFRYISQALVWYRQHGADQLSRNQETLDAKKSQSLASHLRSLHPALYKRYGKKQRIIRSLIKIVYLPIRHPGVLLIILRSLPSAVIQGLRHILHNVKIYLNTK